MLCLPRNRKGKLGGITLILLMLSLCIAPPAVAEAEANQSLVLWYEFDNIDETTVLDSSLHSNNGVMYGGSQWTETLFEEGLKFDGVDDYVEIDEPTGMEFGTGDFSVSAWVRIPSHNESVRYIVSAKTAEHNTAWGLFLSTDDRAYSYCRDSAGNQIYSNSDEVLTTGEWVHLFGKREDGVVELYVNGVKQTAVASGADTNYSSPIRLRVGAEASSLRGYLYGTIDEVRIYNRALNDEEIAREVLGVPFSDIHSFTQKMDLGVGEFWSFGNGFTLVLEDFEENVARLALYESFSKSSELVVYRDDVGKDFIISDLENGPVIKFGLVAVKENSITLGSIWIADAEITAPTPIVQDIGIVKWFFDNELGRSLLEFDGVDDYVEIDEPTGMEFGTGDFSVSAWVRIPSHNESVRYIVSAKTAEHNTAWGLFLSTDDRAIFFCRDSVGTARSCSSDGVLATGEWVHLFGERRDRAVELYINGVEQASSPTGADMNYSSPIRLRVGAEASLLRSYLYGTIDEVCIYDRALSDFEVESLCNGAKVENGLISQWKFDGRGGEMIYDGTSHSNDGTIHGVIRAQDELVLEVTIQNGGKMPLERVAGLCLEMYVDGEKVETEDLSQLELQVSEKTYVGAPWRPTELGEHEIEARITHRLYEHSFSKKFDVEPPVNPPIESLFAFAAETDRGITLSLDIKGEWGYPGEYWDTNAKIEVYRHRLFKNILVRDLGYHISGSNPELVIPYRDFYEGDGEYLLKVHLMDAEGEALVRVAGEDGEYDPPKDALWLMLTTAISFLMILGYFFKTRHRP